jgi:hypothetical protein
MHMPTQKERQVNAIERKAVRNILTFFLIKLTIYLALRSLAKWLEKNIEPVSPFNLSDLDMDNIAAINNKETSK